MCRVAFRRRAVTVGVLSSAIYANCQQPLEAQKRNTPTLDVRPHRITTYLPLTPLPQLFGDSLDIVTRGPPAQLFWYLLESSLGEGLLAPG
jgi:hypothetical protein